MSIKVEIIADSINSSGNRLTTFILEYPRFIHAEVMTHRVFSKNAASSRAIPIEKMIEQIKINPAMPVWWGKNQSGMQAKEELSDEKTHYIVQGELDGYYSDKDLAKYQWLHARDRAIESVNGLMKLGVHKQIANRILEPWFNIRIILSGTEFENFFALRDHPDAQPELQRLATMMLEAYNASNPKRLSEGEWHIPFGDKFDNSKLHALVLKINNNIVLDMDGWLEDEIIALKKKIAIARCARVSYLNFEGKDDYENDIKLCDRLFGNVPRHLSPTEHVASAMGNSDWCGNFRGFKQYRKYFADENLKDSRVIKK